MAQAVISTPITAEVLRGDPRASAASGGCAPSSSRLRCSPS